MMSDSHLVTSLVNSAASRSKMRMDSSVTKIPANSARDVMIPVVLKLQKVYANRGANRKIIIIILIIYNQFLLILHIWTLYTHIFIYFYLIHTTRATRATHATHIFFTYDYN